MYFGVNEEEIAFGITPYFTFHSTRHIDFSLLTFHLTNPAHGFFTFRFSLFT